MPGTVPPRLLVEDLRSAQLRDCSLAVAGGEIVCLRGASGSGKTLLLRAIADLDPNNADVALDGVSRRSMSGPAWRRQVRFVAAEPAWWADRVGDHFRDPGSAASFAAMLGLPPDCMDWRIGRLSTGEKQRLGLIRALEDAPKVLLLDEPTAALDGDAQTAVEAAIIRRREQGAAIVLVTHSDPQATRLADRTCRMVGGRLYPDEP